MIRKPLPPTMTKRDFERLNRQIGQPLGWGVKVVLGVLFVVVVFYFVLAILGHQ